MTSKYLQEIIFHIIFFILQGSSSFVFHSWILIFNKSWVQVFYEFPKIGESNGITKSKESILGLRKGLGKDMPCVDVVTEALRE